MLIEMPKTSYDPLIFQQLINNSSFIAINDSKPKDYMFESAITNGTSYHPIKYIYAEDLEKCDTEDLGNPQCTAIYNKDIFNYLKTIEV